MRLVVDSLGDVSLHYQKVWVIDVEFDAQEQVAHAFLGLDLSVDVAFHFIVFDSPCYADLLLFLKTRWRKFPTAVVEDKRDRGLGHACIAVFVYELLHLLDAY